MGSYAYRDAGFDGMVDGIELPKNLYRRCQVDFSRITCENWSTLCRDSDDVFEQIGILSKARELPLNEPLVHVSLCNTIVKLASSLDLSRILFKTFSYAINYVRFHDPLFNSLLCLYKNKLDEASTYINAELAEQTNLSYAHYLKSVILENYEDVDMEHILELLMKTVSLDGTQFVGSSVWLSLSSFFLSQGDVNLANYYLSRENGYIPFNEKLLKRIQILRFQNRSDEALALMNRTLAKCSFYDINSLVRSKILLQIPLERNKKRLLKIFKAGVRNNPLDILLWRLYVRSLIVDEDYDEALDGLSKMLRFCENVVPSDWYMRGIIFYRKKMLHEAEINVRIAVLLSERAGQMSTDNLSYRRTLQEIKEQPEYKNELSGDWKVAFKERKIVRIAMLQKALEKDIANDDVLFLIFLELIRFYAKRINAFLALAERFGKKKSFWMALRAESLEVTAERLKKAEKEFSEWMPVYIFKSFFLLKATEAYGGVVSEGNKIKKEKMAREALEKCIELSKEFPFYNHFLYFMIAGRRLEDGQFQEALDIMDEFQKMVGNKFLSGIIIIKSTILQKMDNLPDAREILNFAIDHLHRTKGFAKYDADLGLFYNLLAEVTEDRRKKFEFSKIATRFNPSLFDPYRIRARVLMEAGRCEAAVLEMNRLVSLKPTPKDFKLRSEIKYKMGDINGAECDIRVAVCLEVDETRYRDFFKYFKKVSKNIRTSIWRLRKLYDVQINCHS